jgi:hypothetical protein
MSETIVEILPPHTSRMIRSDCFAKRYQLPSQYQSPPQHVLRHPNQTFSSPSSSSSSDSPAISSPVSIDGEFDERVDVISTSPPPPPATHNVHSHNVVYSVVTIINVGSMESMEASAPPLSDDEREHENNSSRNENEMMNQEAQGQAQAQEPEKEMKICIICYDNFSEPDSTTRDEKYEEECYIKKEIDSFCQTCKYSVHHKCIDDYRASKINDILDARQQRHNNNDNRLNGTFGIKCLTCAREVEKIHISRNGDIDIIKTQQYNGRNNGQNSENENEYQLWRQRHQREEQVQMEEILQQHRRMRQRRGRCQYCKSKLCTICFCVLMFGTLLLVFLRSYY